MRPRERASEQIAATQMACSRSGRWCMIDHTDGYEQQPEQQRRGVSARPCSEVALHESEVEDNQRAGEHDGFPFPAEAKPRTDRDAPNHPNNDGQADDPLAGPLLEYC